MARKRPVMNNHHSYPRSRGGSDNPLNLTRMEVKDHEALHRLFGVQTPTEQITTLLSLNGKTLTKEFKSDVFDLLTYDEPEYYYKNGIIVGRK